MASKRIVICCDGTWNVPYPRRGKQPTNVVKTARAVSPRSSDQVEQVVYYDEGVGTKNRLDWLIGGHTGIGLSGKVLGAYRFLVHNWAESDEVYLFGFSRGAFCVRVLAGFIGSYGLLRKRDLRDLPEAWRLFERQPEASESAKADEIRARARRPFAVTFLGVWDTVEALGLPIPFLSELTKPRLRFHDARLGEHVANAFHAIAIDEIRSAFRPTLWAGEAAAGQRIEQVWFSGAHADCGGGYPERGLSDLTLAWMLRRAEECGLEFSREYEAERVAPDPRQAIHHERRGLHRILPTYERPLLTASPSTERVHWSAARRLDEVADYRPPNLVRALTGDRTGLVTDPSEDRRK